MFKTIFEVKLFSHYFLGLRGCLVITVIKVYIIYCGFLVQGKVRNGMDCFVLLVPHDFAVSGK